jgi:hypothetical protein
MRDMQSCGIASIHTGIPLWLLRDRRQLLQKAFQGNSFLHSLYRLIEVSSSAPSGAFGLLGYLFQDNLSFLAMLCLLTISTPVQAGPHAQLQDYSCVRGNQRE